MTNRNRNMERAIRRRERKRLADLNRNDRSVFEVMIKVTLTALAVIIGLAIWIWAAETQAEKEAFAAALRRTRLIRREELMDTECFHVPPLPEVLPADGEPPQAIEIKEAKQAEKLPAEPAGHWENLGRHKITHYCPERCCNGENAWETASGAPMTFGRTVAASAREFPFGTKLRIDGKEYTVEDRGVGPGCIDILVPTHKEGRQRGRFYTDVYVWRED